MVGRVSVGPTLPEVKELEGVTFGALSEKLIATQVSKTTSPNQRR